MATAMFEKTSKKAVVQGSDVAVELGVVLPIEEGWGPVSFKAEYNEDVRGGFSVCTYLILRDGQWTVDTMYRRITKDGIRCILVEEGQKEVFKLWKNLHPYKTHCHIVRAIRIVGVSRTGKAVFCRVEKWMSEGFQNEDFWTYAYGLTQTSMDDLAELVEEEVLCGNIAHQLAEQNPAEIASRITTLLKEVRVPNAGEGLALRVLQLVQKRKKERELRGR